MNTQITQEQIDAFERDGFTIIDQFVGEDEIEELLTAIDACIEELGNKRIAGEGRDLVDDDQYSKTFLQRLNLWMISEMIEAVPVVLKRGGAGAHNSMLAHAAGPNMTPYWRRAMTCSYMPEGANVNGLQNLDRAQSLRIGDVMDDDAMVPLVWSRGAASV
jgi:hypothetical protein